MTKNLQDQKKGKEIQTKTVTKNEKEKEMIVNAIEKETGVIGRIEIENVKKIVEEAEVEVATKGDTEDQLLHQKKGKIVRKILQESPIIIPSIMIIIMEGIIKNLIPKANTNPI
jgi:hypothetical protein